MYTGIIYILYIYISCQINYNKSKYKFFSTDILTRLIVDFKKYSFIELYTI